eukprot:Amastigsp_a339288_298.p2 type:complete len:330 gc:universal Amastigsp_a339288_298:1018-29(-)
MGVLTSFFMLRRALFVLLAVAVVNQCAGDSVSYRYPEDTNKPFQFYLTGDLTIESSGTPSITYEVATNPKVAPPNVGQACGQNAQTTVDVSFPYTIVDGSSDSSSKAPPLLATLQFIFQNSGPVAGTSAYGWSLVGLTLSHADFAYTILSPSSSSSIIAASSAAKFGCPGGEIRLAVVKPATGEIVGSFVLSNYTLYGAMPCANAPKPRLTTTKCSRPTICSNTALAATYECAGDDYSTDSDAVEREEGTGGFFVFLAVIFSMYCCCGIAYKRFIAKAEGIDQLPNSAFWVGVASACGAGFAFVRSGCRRSPSSNGWTLGSSEPPPYDW